MSDTEMRPKIYLSCLTDEEMMSFCYRYAASAMEQELLKRFTQLKRLVEETNEKED